jgi:hypothetical protein
MIASDFARLLHARPIGRGRWTAQCPVHEDRSPSLSIATGRDGRVLVHCFAGCSTEAVLEAAGIRMADLYAGPPPTPAQARQVAAERIQRDMEARAICLRRGNLADRYRKLTALVETVGKRLASLADDEPTSNALTKLFHFAVDRQRATESELEVSR